MRLGTNCLVVLAGLSVASRCCDWALVARKEKSVGGAPPTGRIMSKWPDVAGLKLPPRCDIYLYV